MGRIAIAFGLLLILALFWRALRPGTPLWGSIISAPRQSVSPPYTFRQIDANTVINLP